MCLNFQHKQARVPLVANVFELTEMMQDFAIGVEPR